ncbi:MAG: PHP domain-containing protein [archaeon]
MSSKFLVNKNKFFYIIKGIVLAWIILLVILAVIGLHDVGFFNYLTDENVSAEYSIHIPLLRYIFEPIIGSAFYLTIKYYYFPLVLIAGYLIYRIIYLVGKKNKQHSKKFKLLMHSFREFFKFVAIVGLIALGVIIAYFLIGFLIVGTFIKYGFATILELVSITSSIGILIKVAQILYKFYHPHLQFNIQKRLRERKQYNKYLSITGRELGYFFCFVFLLVIANVLLMTTVFPLGKIQTERAENEILLDFHAHTTLSDGWLSPEERVQWYLEQGIDVAAISDHQTTEGAKLAQRYVQENNLPLNIIIAQEYTTSYGIHLNIYGIEENIIPIEYKDETEDLSLNTEEMIKYVKKEGGYVIVNHYNAKENKNGGFGVPYNYTQLKQWGVDGFEIINSGNLYPEKIKKFCLENDLICIAATDVHQNGELTGFMKVKLESGEFTLDNLFTSLENNEHQAIQITRYGQLVDFPEPFDNFEEIELFINYILHLNTFQYISWILWSLFGYMAIHYAYLKIRKYELELLKKKML